MLVATMCISPKRAMTLKRWMFNCKDKMNHHYRDIPPRLRVTYNYSRIHEYEVHLHEGKYHLQQRIYTSKNYMAWWCKWNFEKRSYFQASIYHCSQSKSWKIIMIMMMLWTPILWFALPIAPILKKKLPWASWVVLRRRGAGDVAASGSTWGSW